MTRKELIQTIENARGAIRAYRMNQQPKQSRAKEIITETLEQQNLEKAVRELIQESFEVGLAGTPCERCHGTGREP